MEKLVFSLVIRIFLKKSTKIKFGFKIIQGKHHLQRPQNFQNFPRKQILDQTALSIESGSFRIISFKKKVKENFQKRLRQKSIYLITLTPRQPTPFFGDNLHFRNGFFHKKSRKKSKKIILFLIQFCFAISTRIQLLRILN